MKVMVFNNHEEMSRSACEILLTTMTELIANRDFIVFLPSAGKSPTMLYRNLLEHKNELDWQKVVVVQMDDYIDLDINNRSFSDYLLEHLIRPLGIRNFIALPRMACRVAAQKYIYYHEQIINELGGIDIALHGIGINGHIGFNEPGCSKEQASGIFKLCKDTIEANQTFCHEALSLGLGCLAKSRRNMIIASGTHKRNAVQRLIQSECFTSELPASILIDKNSTLFIDKACA